MATKRLKAEDGEMYVVTKGTAIAGDGTTPLAAGKYICKTVLSTGSGLPTGIRAKLAFTAKGTEVPAVGESVIPLTFTRKCDLKSAVVDFNKNEIDATVNCDDGVNVYLPGSVDASGSMEGITIAGVTDEAGGFAEKFLTRVETSADQETITVTDKNDNFIILQLVTNKVSSVGENTSYYLFPININTFTGGVPDKNNMQTFTSAFRIAADDDLTPAFYVQKQPVV